MLPTVSGGKHRLRVSQATAETGPWLADCTRHAWSADQALPFSGVISWRVAHEFLAAAAVLFPEARH